MTVYLSIIGGVLMGGLSPAAAQVTAPRANKFQNMDKRVRNISSNLSVDEQTARQIAVIRDQFTDKSNDIYNDSTLTDQAKLTALESLKVKMEADIAALIGPEKSRKVGIGRRSPPKQ